MVTHIVSFSLERYLTFYILVQDLPLILDSATSLNQLLTSDDTPKWEQGVEACKNLANALRIGIISLFNLIYTILKTSPTF